MLLVITFIAATILAPTPVYAELPPVSVTVDTFPVSFSTAPVIISGRVMVPFKPVADALGVRVQWEKNTQTITADYGPHVIRMQINKKMAFYDNKPISIDVAPMIRQSRTLVPLGFFASGLGCQARWDNNLRCAKIYSPSKAMTILGFYALGDSKTSSWTNLFGKPYPEVGDGNTGLISDLALGWFSADAQGVLLAKSTSGWQRPSGWENVLNAAAAFKINSDMMVFISDHDGVLSSIVRDNQASSALIESIVSTVGSFRGVNLDLEAYMPMQVAVAPEAYREPLNAFVKQLAEKLHSQGKTLTLTIPPPNSHYIGYDYAVLGQYADRIVIMAYEYGPKPEPIEMVKDAVTETLQFVPANKLVLGICIPYETPNSILDKIALAKHYKLNGIALWRLGLLNADTWRALYQSVSKI
ncbi:MAG: stalk domain-containing protein [Candidatus Saccharibacteria bacterium]